MSGEGPMWSFTASPQPAVSGSSCSSLLIACVVFFVFLPVITKNWTAICARLTFVCVLWSVLAKQNGVFQLKIATHQLHSCFVSPGFPRNVPHATPLVVLSLHPFFTTEGGLWFTQVGCYLYDAGLLRSHRHRLNNRPVVQSAIFIYFCF